MCSYPGLMLAIPSTAGLREGWFPGTMHARSLTLPLTHSLTQSSRMSPPCVYGACSQPTYFSRAWSAVALVATFNCMDFLGRWILRWEVLVWKKPELLWVSE